MSKATKDKMTLFTALLVAVMALCFFPAKKVSAGEVSIPSKSGQTICCMMTDKKEVYGIWEGELKKLPHGKNMTIVSFKSSNQKVVKAWIEKDKYWGGIYPRLKLNKPGTTKLTLTYKSGTKQYKYTVNVQVIKYQNPFKTFKIGNKNYASVFNKVNAWGVTTKLPKLKNGTYKFELKLNKNFSIRTAELQQTAGKKVKNVNIKNAKKIKITKDAYFSFLMKYKNINITNICFQGNSN